METQTEISRDAESIARFVPIARLKRDIRVMAAKALSLEEGRYLVDLYYQIQEVRKATANQIRSMAEVEKDSTLLIRWVCESMELLEAEITKCLDTFTDGNPLSRWSKSVVGIGPILSAGLLAHIDISKAETAGAIWRYAGLDPTMKWEKGQKRPWNATLKTICWKAAESWVKVQNNENDFYGHLFVKRKAQEVQRNNSGTFADQARARATELEKLHKTTSESYKWYAGCYPREAAEGFLELSVDQRAKRLKKMEVEKGAGLPMLPPAHIHARATRFVKKIFLSHYFEIGYKILHGKEPPRPFAQAILGHAHYIAPPGTS